MEAQTHGVLVEVLGVGILLLGPSGIGKSECALELVTRGHRLVADDVVQLRRDGAAVYGAAPERIRHYTEIRGIGLLYVPDLYGPDAVRDEAEVDLVVRLERWREGAEYERVGLERASEKVAGIERPCLLLPVRPATSMATLTPARRRCGEAPGPAAPGRRHRVSEAMRVIFVAGLSGSGKTTAMAALEDLSFYSVDNLPPVLIEQFVDLCRKATPPITKVAVALDAREPSFLRAFPGVVEQLRALGADVEVLFLDCSNDALVNRYRETRRVHPLSPGGKVEDGIEEERRLLAEVTRLADYAVDTSRLNVHQLRETVVRHVAGGTRNTVLNLVSFGFRFGVPASAELMFDVRFLPNPYFEPDLRARTGEDPAVAEFVLKNAPSEALLERLRELLHFLLPLYDDEGRAYLTIGIGCTGGQHRSVAIVEALAGELRGRGREVNVEHRELERVR